MSRQQTLRQLNRLRATVAGRRLNETQEATLDGLLEQLYSHDNPVFYCQDKNGFPLRQIAQGCKPVIKNRLNPNDWVNEARPRGCNRRWPPREISDVLSNPGVESVCGVCFTNVRCRCSYGDGLGSTRQWTAWAMIRDVAAEGRGYGLFAADKLVGKTILGEYAGVVKPYSSTREDIEYQAKIYIGPAPADDSKEQPTCSIDGTHYGSAFRFMNHSCNPNAQLIQARCGMNVQLVVVRVLQGKTILRGEEITIDYGAEWAETLRNGCRCGDENCRYPPRNSSNRGIIVNTSRQPNRESNNGPRSPPQTVSEDAALSTSRRSARLRSRASRSPPAIPAGSTPGGDGDRMDVDPESDTEPTEVNETSRRTRSSAGVERNIYQTPKRRREDPDDEKYNVTPSKRVARPAGTPLRRSRR